MLFFPTTEATYMAGPHDNDWAIRHLRAAIDRDGRGVKRFSAQVLVRPHSTIYRWLNGSRPIPKCVKTWLIGDFRILAEPIGTPNTEGEAKHE